MIAYVVSSLSEVEKLKESWKRIYANSSQENPFLCWEWNWLWMSCYTSLDSVRVIVVKDGEKIICIAPFCIKNKEISFLADSLYSDYMDIIAEECTSDVVKLVTKKLIEFKDWDRLSLLTLPGNSDSHKYFELELKKHTISAEKSVIHANPYIDITGQFDAYIQSRSNGVKKELRRSKNKLDKTFERWEFFEAKNLSENQEVLDALVRFHLGRQGAKVGTSIFEDKKNRDFYKGLICNTEIPWDIHLCGIKADGEFVTASISIITNNVLYYWITAFDYSLGGGSIGNFHVRYLTEKCFKEGYKRLDFMGGTEAYKMRWATGSYDNYRVLAYRSRFKLLRDRVWSVLRKKLQYLKDNSRTWNLIWIQISKFVGK